MDAYELISFKLGMMIDTTVVLVLNPVSVTWSFIQGLRVIRKLELVGASFSEDTKRACHWDRFSRTSHTVT